MDEVSEVKDKINIVDLIGGYLTLKKAGVNYKGLCPFHNEKTPSFMVSPERQTFKCFGCGKGGDAFTFVEEIEGMDFYDSLKLLAGRVGVELKPKGNFYYGEKEFAPTEKSKAYEINELAARLYHKILIDHPKAEHARKYLKNRGIGKEAIKNFNLGYAPRSWDLLIKFLAKHNYSDKDAFKAGLLVLGENGRYWDRFRGRIMFPINNISGQVIAFTGRILEDDDKSAKYVNSAESPIYIKGKTIYGLDKARIDIRAQNSAVLVEGNMDVIACHQAGFRNAIAVSGTALTADQLKIIARYSPNIIFSFDNDTAGKNALKKAITLALLEDLNSSVINFHGFKDPDEAIKSDPKNWERAVKSAKPALENWIDQLVLEYDINDVNQKKIVSKEILPVLKLVANDLERDHYIRYFSGKIAVSESSILSQLAKTKELVSANEDEKNVSAEKIDFEKRLAGLIWQDKRLVGKIPPIIFEYNFSDKVATLFFESIKCNKEIKNLPPFEKSVLDLYAVEATSELDLADDSIIEREFFDLVKNLVLKKKELTKKQYAERISQAQAEGDILKIKKLMVELQSAIIDKD